ncbi:MAG: sigma-54-dependent transcriptional regulator [Candidatus Marinamargulisbacteria bacterium]
MSPPKILIIDDDETIYFSFKTFLNADIYHLDYSRNGKEGLEHLTNSKPDVIIADYKMPEMTGLEFLKAAKIIAPNVPIIMISAHSESNLQKTFKQEGAFAFQEKPFDIEEMLSTITLAIKKENQSSTSTTESTFIGSSHQINDLFTKLDKIKTTDITILLQGESGTGKDLIATKIHESSNVKNGPFISLNCAAIPENLIESELFGYEKGAFTGAEEKKLGKFELAENGTLFLDEIGELPHTVQAKLLRVLQNRNFERIGGTLSISSNARIIAATNQNLHQMINEGKFREDLYYRLSNFPLEIPPLRDRCDDIVAIASYLFERFSNEFNKPLKSLSECGEHAFKSYAWPGNVREMQNVISRIVLLESALTINEKIIHQYLPKDEIISINSPDELGFIANYTEKELLKIHANETFKLCNFNKSETAKKLGINYRTLVKRLSD